MIDKEYTEEFKTIDYRILYIKEEIDLHSYLSQIDRDYKYILYNLDNNVIIYESTDENIRNYFNDTYLDNKYRI